MEMILFVTSFILICWGFLSILYLLIRKAVDLAIELILGIHNADTPIITKKKKKPKNRNKVADFIYNQLLEEYGEENVYGSPFHPCMQIKTKRDHICVTITITESEYE